MTVSAWAASMAIKLVGSTVFNNQDRHEACSASAFVHPPCRHSCSFADEALDDCEA